MSATRQILIKRLTKIINYLKSIHPTDSLRTAVKPYMKVIKVMDQVGYPQFAQRALLNVGVLANLPFNKQLIQNVVNAGQLHIASVMKQANQKASKLESSQMLVEIHDRQGRDRDAEDRPLRPIMASDVEELIRDAIYFIHYTYAIAKINGTQVTFPKVNWIKFHNYCLVMSQCAYLAA